MRKHGGYYTVLYQETMQVWTIGLLCQEHFPKLARLCKRSMHLTHLQIGYYNRQYKVIVFVILLIVKYCFHLTMTFFTFLTFFEQYISYSLKLKRNQWVKSNHYYSMKHARYFWRKLDFISMKQIKRPTEK